MRSAYLWSLMLLLTPFGVAGAQRPDTSSVRRDSLRHRIEERFAVRAQQELRLTNEQTTKLRATSQQFGARRAELRTRGKQLREAMTAQLQPGVAANQDSVAKLTDAMIELKISRGADLARRDQGAIEVSQRGPAGPALRHAGALYAPSERGLRASGRPGVPARGMRAPGRGWAPQGWGRAQRASTDASGQHRPQLMQE